MTVSLDPKYRDTVTYPYTQCLEIRARIPRHFHFENVYEFIHWGIDVVIPLLGVKSRFAEQSTAEHYEHTDIHKRHIHAIDLGRGVPDRVDPEPYLTVFRYIF